ncbi:MAG: ATP-binding cassette domain-containing protein, partial [Nocardioidaceae bacterium]
MPDEPLLAVQGVSKAFVSTRRRKKHTTLASNDVSLRVDVGDAMGVVGESGCGKTTLANMIMRLDHPDGGEIRYRGEPLTGARAAFPYG